MGELGSLGEVVFVLECICKATNRRECGPDRSSAKARTTPWSRFGPLKLANQAMQVVEPCETSEKLMNSLSKRHIPEACIRDNVAARRSFKKF